MIEFIPYTHSIYEFVDKEGEEIFWDLYLFETLPSNWKQGMTIYKTKIFTDTSLWDLKPRIVKFNCTCKDYINRKRKCKHIIEAEKQLNRFIDISYDSVPVS